MSFSPAGLLWISNLVAFAAIAANLFFDLIASNFFVCTLLSS